MSEVMTCSTVGESFSYSKSELDQMQTGKESNMLIGNDIEDESTLSFSDKLDIASDKSSENTICGSDDSVASPLKLAKNLPDMIDEIQDSANSTIRSDTSCDDYEYMTTETTVINTTYNISQSSVRDIKVLKGTQHASSLTTKKDIENKRVVVQILSSDIKDSAKSVGIFENKSTNNESQSTHSFRDDVCKLLTSSRPTLDYGSDTIEEKDFKDAFNVPHNSIKTVSSVESSMKIMRSKRRRCISPFLLYDKGPKLSDIKNVSKHLKAATAGALRIIHFMLYDKYGLCGNEMQLAQTRRRILHFAGFPFDNKSSKYQKRLKSLLKMPLAMLLDMHRAVFGKTSNLGRMHMANNLMTIFSNTERYNEIISHMEPNVEFIPENEYITLKKKAIFGPLPIVRVKKLNLDDLAHVLRIKESDPKMLVGNENVQSESKKKKNEIVDDSYALPAYILQGPGRKLKNFLSIVENVNKASEKELNLLHHLLYGRVESIDVCRRNILEFSGFLNCQNEFIIKVNDILNRLDKAEITNLCKILCLRAKTNSRKLKIIKVMEYLKKPFKPLRVKRVTGYKRKFFPENSQPKLHISESRVSVHPLELWDEPENIESGKGGYRLRDFRKICSNIECSAPSDLTELNDLLFIKPTDDTEIHDRILNFTRFGFSESSVHYHYRKTLMFYMGSCIVRKIAKLLDIENWHSVSNHEDLSAYILNFLMKKKGPDSLCNKSSMSPSFSSPCDKLESLPGNNIPVEIAQQTNQTITSQHENVFISKVSKSSMLADLGNPCNNEYMSTESEKRCDHILPSTSNIEDDLVPLRHFIHHPTDQELIKDIDGIVKNGLFSITLGDVVKKVYLLYPHFNLVYRESFIKCETRKIVSRLRQNAVEHMKQNSAT